MIWVGDYFLCGINHSLSLQLGAVQLVDTKHINEDNDVIQYHEYYGEQSKEKLPYRQWNSPPQEIDDLIDGHLSFHR